MKKIDKRPFFDLSAKEKKKVIKIAIKEANKDQRDLIEKSKKVIKRMSVAVCQ